MSLTHETTVSLIGAVVGDIKVANYDITFTANQLVEPTNDPGWFLLNGSVISQTTYPLLFARFGSTFNTGGEGTGNFRLPNYTEGKVPISMGLSNFTSYASSGGEINNTLSSTQVPVHLHGNSFTTPFTANAHGHTGSGSAANGGAHTHNYNLVSTVLEPGASALVQVTGTGPTATSSWNGFHTHFCIFTSYGTATEGFNKSGGVQNSSGGASHNNMMPFIVVGGYLVKHD